MQILGLSPGQKKFARILRDQVPVDPSKMKLRPKWVLTADQREAALARHHVASEEFWSLATREHGDWRTGSGPGRPHPGSRWSPQR